MKASKLDRKWKKEVGKSEVNPNSLWDRLAIVERSACARPQESFTANEYAIQRQVTRSVAQGRLRRLVAMGKLTKHKIPNSNKTYWSIPNPKV